MDPTLSEITTELSRSVPNIVGAIAILVVGWLIAIIAAWVVKAILSRTRLDNRLARWITGRDDSAAVTNIEKWTASAVFWIIMIFVLVAFLQALQLTAVSEPLNNFLQQVFAYLPRIAGAALLLGVAWLIATLARTVLVKGLKAFSLDEKLNQAGRGNQPSPPRTPPTVRGATLQQGDTVQQPQPPAAGGSPFILSETLGDALYWFIFLLFLPAILGALQLDGLLLPVRNLLNNILNILPNILAALIIGAIGWFGARIVQMLVTNLLTATGFNNVFYWLGLQERPYQVPDLPAAGTANPERSAASRSAALQQRTPSEVVGIIVLVGILLFTTVEAVNVLGFTALTAILTGLLVLLGRILAGLIIFAIGLYLANLAFKLIISSGSGQARVLAHAARVAIIVLISAMALQQIGVASSIVNLAFGLLLGAIAVAIALAFGLGSMDIAAAEVRGWLDAFKRQDRLPPR